MKKALFALLLTYGLTSLGQNKFEWDVVDSTDKTKNEIYSATKMFIANYWKSAQSVVQNDDKEGGIILIKGSIIKETTHILSSWTFVYNYTMTFKMKDNKFKVTLNNVYCSDAYIQTGKKMNKIEPCLPPNCPDNGSFDNPAPNIKNINAMMKSLHAELYMIIIDYIGNLKASGIKKDDW